MNLLLKSHLLSHPPAGWSALNIHQRAHLPTPGPSHYDFISQYPLSILMIVWFYSAVWIFLLNSAFLGPLFSFSLCVVLFYVTLLFWVPVSWFPLSWSSWFPLSWSSWFLVLLPFVLNILVYLCFWANILLTLCLLYGLQFWIVPIKLQPKSWSRLWHFMGIHKRAELILKKNSVYSRFWLT